MTLKELMGNDAFKKELEEAAKAAAPKNDKEYFEVIIREAAKHGVETNENELRAYAVSKMPVDEKSLKIFPADTVWWFLTFCRHAFSVIHALRL